MLEDSIKLADSFHPRLQVDMSTIAVNLRCLGHHTTGVQRYVQQMAEHLEGALTPIKPNGIGFQGIKGHLWEQFVLPSLIKGKLLWSPANTGPLSISKQVVTIHDAATLDHPEWFGPTFARWYAWMLPRLAAKARKVITVSEFSRVRLVESLKLPPEKVESIHNGVSASFTSASPEQIETVCKKMGLKRPFFLYVGSIEPRKNLSRLLQAWRIFGDDRFLLVVAGSVGHVFKDSGIGKLPPRVRLIGRVDNQDLPVLYTAAQAFIFPSIYEGFGLPPLEAMACGCPCLVSNTTSLPEVCGPAWSRENNEGTSLYFDPSDPEEIANVITLAAAFNEEERMKLKHRAVAHSRRFTWEECARKTANVLEDMSNV